MPAVKTTKTKRSGTKRAVPTKATKAAKGVTTTGGPARRKAPSPRTLAARATRAKLFGKGGSSVPAKSSGLAVDAEMMGIIEAYAFGDIWSRPGLPLKTRSLITVAMLTALYRTDQLRAHVNAALNLGIKPEQILEAILHAGAYAGLPTGANGKSVALQVFRKRGIVKD